MLPFEQELIKLIQTIHEERRAGKAEQEIFGDFKASLKGIIQQNYLAATDIVIDTLTQLTDEGQEIGPSYPDDRDINIWRWCWASFLELGEPFGAEKVMESCYTHMLRLQKKNSKRYHKGTPLQTRAEGLSKIGQWAKAKRFVILAFIEDLITGQKTAPAWQTLISVGVSDSDLKLIERETESLVQSYAKKGQQPPYPEEVFQRVHYKMEFATIGELARDIVYTNSEYLRHLLDLVDAASTTDDKRRTLENLAQYLFSSVEGLYVEPARRTGPYELDGIISNSSTHPFLRTLDTYIPIECKNWREAVGSPEITQFIGKLSLFKCNTGILLSKEGIKGKTVNELRKDAYRRSNIYILVFDAKDVYSIIEGRDLISLMVDKFKELKFSIKM